MQLYNFVNSTIPLIEAHIALTESISGSLVPDKLDEIPEVVHELFGQRLEQLFADLKRQDMLTGNSNLETQNPIAEDEGAATEHHAGILLEMFVGHQSLANKIKTLPDAEPVDRIISASGASELEFRDQPPAFAFDESLGLTRIPPPGAEHDPPNRIPSVDLTETPPLAEADSIPNELVAEDVHNIAHDRSGDFGEEEDVRGFPLMRIDVPFWVPNHPPAVELPAEPGIRQTVGNLPVLATGETESRSELAQADEAAPRLSRERTSISLSAVGKQRLQDVKIEHDLSPTGDFSSQQFATTNTSESSQAQRQQDGWTTFKPNKPIPVLHEQVDDVSLVHKSIVNNNAPVAENLVRSSTPGVSTFMPVPTRVTSVASTQHASPDLSTHSDSKAILKTEMKVAEVDQPPKTAESLPIQLKDSGFALGSNENAASISRSFTSLPATPEPTGQSASYTKVVLSVSNSARTSSSISTAASAALPDSHSFHRTNETPTDLAFFPDAVSVATSIANAGARAVATMNQPRGDAISISRLTAGISSEKSAAPVEADSSGMLTPTTPAVQENGQGRGGESRMASVPQESSIENGVIERITNVLEASLADRKPQSNEQLRIQLQPEELGSIDVVFRKEGNICVAEIIVADEAVKQIVDSRLESLQENLRNYGVEHVRIEFAGSETGGHLQNHPRQRDEQPKPPAQKRNAFDREVSAVASVSTPDTGRIDVIA